MRSTVSGSSRSVSGVKPTRSQNSALPSGCSARAGCERFSVEAMEAPVAELDQSALLLVAQDGVDGRAGRSDEPGQCLLREEDHGMPVGVLRIQSRELVEPPEDPLVDGKVERLEQPLVQHANLADEEAEERFGYLAVLLEKPLEVVPVDRE